MNVLISHNVQLSSKLEDRYSKTTINGYDVIVDGNQTQIETSSLLGFLDGYLTSFDHAVNNVESQQTVVCEHCLENWPLTNTQSGSFALALISKQTGNLVFCNDVIGVYPLYYGFINDGFVVSSSLLLLSKFFNIDVDNVGFAESALSSEMSLVGSRTLLEGIKRLLPGEYITFNPNTPKSLEKQYDNTLYKDLSDASQNTTEEVATYVDLFQKEVAYITAPYNHCNLALSGGLDSRVLLGVLPKEKDLHCHTYGPSDSYEVFISKRLAAKAKREFINYDSPELYFPKKDILEKYTSISEGFGVVSWLEILEGIPNDRKRLLLLGDMTEALQARNIKRYSGRNARVKNFWSTIVRKRAFVFTPSSSGHFSTWKTTFLERELQRFSDERLNALELDVSFDAVRKEVVKDWEALFKRIEAHELPYVELFDELLSWYTHARVPMGKQILMCNYTFTAVCPAMSTALMRMTSSIHPNQRLNNRFLRKVFMATRELKSLYKIPTSQAPWVPQNWHPIFSFLMWGVRSKVDNKLIQRLVKSRNPNSRYRWFKGIDWVQLYQNDQNEVSVQNYFEPNELGIFGNEYCLSQLKNRKTLVSWPYSNIDIIALSTLNVFINKLKQKDA